MKIYRLVFVGVVMGTCLSVGGNILNSNAGVANAVQLFVVAAMALPAAFGFIKEFRL